MLSRTGKYWKEKKEKYCREKTRQAESFSGKIAGGGLSNVRAY